MNIPNLLVIGAMKSGTTTLHNHLACHPDILMSTHKEPSYFQHVESESERRGLYDALFAGLTSERYAGESSANYTKHPLVPHVPERIAAQNPNMSMIYIMRDPIERLISQYRHWTLAKIYKGSLWQFVQDVPHAVDTSNYGMQLEQYYRYFDPAQIFTLTLEEYSADTESSMSALLRWLQLGESAQVSRYRRREFASASMTIDKDKAGLLYPFMRLPVVRRLGRTRTLKRLRDRMKRTYGISTEIDDDDLARAVDYLRPIQLEQVEGLSSLLGRSFPMWTTLCGDSTENRA